MWSGCLKLVHQNLTAKIDLVWFFCSICWKSNHWLKQKYAFIVCLNSIILSLGHLWKELLINQLVPAFPKCHSIAHIQWPDVFSLLWVANGKKSFHGTLISIHVGMISFRLEGNLTNLGIMCYAYSVAGPRWQLTFLWIPSLTIFKDLQA